jgi:hypothetical protein
MPRHRAQEQERRTNILEVLTCNLPSIEDVAPNRRAWNA